MDNSPGLLGPGISRQNLLIASYFNPSKNTCSVKDQDFVGVKMHALDLALVVHAAKDGYHFALHIPGRWYNKFGASKNIGGVDLDATFKIRLCQVNLRAAHEAYDISTLESFAQYNFFHATKDRRHIKEIPPVGSLVF